MGNSEVIKLCDGAVEVTTLLHEDDGKRPAVIIIPGGSYSHVVSHEGMPVAEKFFSKGFSCFIVSKYSVGRASRFPAPLVEIATVVAHVRKNASCYGVDPHKIITLGFSAGGHMAAMLGAFWHESKFFEGFDFATEDIRPDAQILAYPFLNFHDVSGFVGDDLNKMKSMLPPALSALLEPETNQLLAAKKGLPSQLGINENKWNAFANAILSSPVADMLPVGAILLENRDEVEVTEYVSSLTPPTFIWHSVGDKVIPATQSAEMAVALHKVGVPYSLHLFETGGHGTGVTEVSKEVDAWTDMAENWLKSRGIV